MKGGAGILVSLCIGAVFANGASAQADSHAACDRECLIGITNQYVAALVAHTPTQLPVAPGVKFTENLVPLKFGEQGLWNTVTGRRDFTNRYWPNNSSRTRFRWSRKAMVPES